MALKRLLWRKYLFVGRSEGETEQQYWNEKRKRHLAHEHTEGLVTGLAVTETTPPSLAVAVAAGRALDTDGHDPEVESPQELDCAALVPATGEVTVYCTLRAHAVETDPYFVEEIGASQNKYLQDAVLLEVSTTPPSAPTLELARFRLAVGATAITNAADPATPGLNEIDLRQVKHSGTETLRLVELADVDSNAADAFHHMANPSAANPIATVSQADSLVVPVRSEVEAARGSHVSLDARLDVMLDDAGAFKGITQISPAVPLTGGGVAGDVPLGITDATPTARGALSAADKAKLDGIEAGATGDLTPQEILAALQTVDGPGSGLDADTLDGFDASAFQALKIAWGEVAEAATVNLATGTVTDGTYNGDTGFTQIKGAMLAARDSGRHSNQSHHHWTATLTNLTPAGFSVAVYRDDVETLLHFYWLILGV